MQVTDYSHRSGKSTIGTELCRQMREALEGVAFKAHRNCASDLRQAIRDELSKLGWSDKVQIDTQHKLTITAMHGRLGLCLQTGNMARFPYDLLKLQVLFLDERITAAFYLVPTSRCARTMGDNIANFERLTAELKDVFNKVITVPIVVIGFENEEES